MGGGYALAPRVARDPRSIHPLSDHAGMTPRPRLADAASLGFRVARGLHGRWRKMAAPQRKRLEGLADDVKERALELRGAGDPEGAGRDLNLASERLAAAMVEAAQGDPEVPDAQVAELRDDLARELDRLASGEVRASRMTGADTAPGAPGDPRDASLYNPL
jgi:hypothetical protein